MSHSLFFDCALVGIVGALVEVLGMFVSEVSVRVAKQIIQAVVSSGSISLAALLVAEPLS